jgi:cytochrome c oxidase assembly protein Cox11
MLVLAMLGLAYASVPLYRLFCQATGFDGTPQRASEFTEPLMPVGKIVRVRFDANTNSALPWNFKPEHHVDRVAVGAREMAFFVAKNLGDKPVTGSATFNVSPTQAAGRSGPRGRRYTLSTSSMWYTNSADRFGGTHHVLLLGCGRSTVFPR